MSPASETEFLAPNDPVDLSNCHREPIHIPGSIQPHGVLIAVREPEHTVARVSTTLTDLVRPGTTPEAALGLPLARVIGTAAAESIARHTAEHADLLERNPLLVLVDVAGRATPMDAILHRSQGLLIIELETAEGPRPFEFSNSYQLVRTAVGSLNRSLELPELYDTAARMVRELTGFDRVMIYRFDADHNGEVVAEAKRDDLNSFLGLHYPSTDIPAQARALYEKNWVRLIADVDYAPSPVIPVADPITGEHLDLTYSVLRSVSPIHVEYLRNMGVRASMSISLLRDGKLWGLVACHHYAGPHLPPYGVRAAAEFLGSVLSLRLIDRVEEQATRAALVAEATLGRLLGRLGASGSTPLDTLLGVPNLLDLIAADGAFVHSDGREETLGRTPGPALLSALASWVTGRPGEIVVSESLSSDAPELPAAEGSPAGVLAITLPDGAVVGWLREEVVRSVDWGGDPHNKAIALGESGDVRLSPRKSFERWREVVRGRSAPWTPQDVSSAERLRAALVETLFARTRQRMVAAEMFQRSLLPQQLPQPPGWSVAAWYEPATGGQVGGDWYDAVALPDGRTALVVGDVAGHGLEAAGVMAQLRHALRAFLLRGDDPVDALGALDDLVTTTMADQIATLALAITPAVGAAVEVISVGHLPPILIGADGAVPLEVDPSPPLGTGYAGGRGSAGGAVRPLVTEVPDGGTMVLFTDGLLERRDESLEASLADLARALAETDPAADPDAFIARVRDPESIDDATLVVLRRSS